MVRDRARVRVAMLQVRTRSEDGGLRYVAGETYASEEIVRSIEEIV